MQDWVRIVFFAPEFSDVNVIRRIATFRSAGWRIMVPGFFRHRYNRNFLPDFPHIVLGRTLDGQHKRRALLFLLALVRLLRHRRGLAAASLYYARNLDQLWLAVMVRFLLGAPAPLVYESLDVPAGCTDPGLKGRIIRAVERRLMRSVSLLVVSSPAFVRNYYAGRLGWDGPWHLLENKLPTTVPPPAPHRARPGWRWTVGYVGLIRGRQTVRLIAEVARRSPDVLFVFRGIFTTVDAAAFAQLTEGLSNIVYEGEYRNPEDLAAIYAELDFIWALDLENAEHNSRWLLPCRFYEGGWHGVPCLAAEGFEIGNRVAAEQVGWTFAAPYADGIVQHLASLDRAAHAAMCDRLRAMPEAFASDDQGEALCRRLAELDEYRSPATRDAARPDGQASAAPRKPVATT